MKLEQKFTIEGKIVTLIAEFAGLMVFESIEAADEGNITLFFVKNRNVCQRLEIETSYEQNTGFIISQYEFIGV